MRDGRTLYCRLMLTVAWFSREDWDGLEGEHSTHLTTAAGALRHALRLQRLHHPALQHTVPTEVCLSNQLQSGALPNIARVLWHICNSTQLETVHFEHAAAQGMASHDSLQGGHLHLGMGDLRSPLQYLGWHACKRCAVHCKAGRCIACTSGNHCQALLAVRHDSFAPTSSST